MQQSGRTCKNCNQLFSGPKNKLYCSNRCKDTLRNKTRSSTRDLSKRACVNCGLDFIPKQAHPKYKFCSSSCKDKHTKSLDKYKEARKVYMLLDREKNPDKYKARDKKRYEKNKHLFLANNAKRRHKQKQQTPCWEKELTQFVSEEAHHLRGLRDTLTGFKWHVDHVVPLRGKLVCGLNVWNNLQVIPAKLNLQKGNRYAVHEES